MKITQYAKRTKDDYPILRACKEQNLDFIRLRDFLDEYGYFLENGIAYKALELHKSKKWQEIENTAQALNEGQNCYAQFVKDFYEEINTYGGNLDEDSVNV